MPQRICYIFKEKKTFFFCSGSLFTFISVAQVVSTMVGSSVYIPIYILFLQCGWPSKHPSGAVFLIMALVYILTIPLLW